MSTHQGIIYRRRPESKTTPVNASTPGFCSIKAECQSCTYINTDYQLSLKKKFDAGLEILKIESNLATIPHPQVHPSPRKFNFRSHAKLAVRSVDDQSFKIGLFKPGSHEVVDVQTCPVHAEGINELLRDINASLTECQINPYNETSHSGDLRYVAIRRAHVTGNLMVTFVTTKDIKRPLKSLLAILKTLQHKIISAHMNINADVGNKIFGDHTEILSGAQKLREGVCDLTYEISPTSFFQTNPWTAELAYRRIEQLAGQVSPHAKTDHVAWDFFCGAGQISLILARLNYTTIGIDSNSQGIADAKHNASINELSNRVHFIAGNAEDVQRHIPSEFANPELIVTNPSRKGIPAICTDFIVKRIQAQKNTRMIYLSCDIHSLARDLKLICNPETGLRLRQLEAFDMFPFTDKLEWLAVITN